MCHELILNHHICVQLTTETFEEAVSGFALVVEQTRTTPVEQNMEVLGTVAQYLTNIATFVADTNVTINTSVSPNFVLLISHFQLS